MSRPLHEATLMHAIVSIYALMQPPLFPRSLIYCSRSGWCLHELPPNVTLAAGCGAIRAAQTPTQSLVITRQLTASLGQQQLLPARLMRGLLPSALLERYMFWQHHDAKHQGRLVTGYPKVDFSAEVEDIPDESDNATAAIERPSLLRLQIYPEGDPDTQGYGTAKAHALVQRHWLAPSDTAKPSKADDKSLQTEGKPMTLLNLLNGQKATALYRLGVLLSGLENLSHCLAWATEEVQGLDAAVSVSVVELPRLRLTFTLQDHVLVCRQLHNLRIMEEDPTPSLRKLLRGIPNRMLLQDASGNVFVLVSAVTKPEVIQRRAAPGRLGPSVMLNRSDATWAARLQKAPYYLYTAHPSHAFLTKPTLASSLYLVLLWLVDGQHSRVFENLDSCVR